MYKFNNIAKSINMKTILKNKYIILIPLLILNIISLMYLKDTNYFIKQLIWIILGYLIFFISTKIKVKKIFKYIKYLYITCLLLLGIVLILGREINGSKAWLHIFGISIQPSEITKVILALYLSYLTSKKKNVFLLLIVFIPSILTFLEPDTGAIIIYLIIFLSCLKYFKVNKKYLIMFSILLILLLSTHIYLYIKNKDLLIKIYGTKLFYRIDRIISFKNQDNIQTIHSLISIGAHKLLYIPENHNDFIFASIISKYNILISILTFTCLISILLYYIFNITKKKNISNIFNFIILNILTFQIFYNILMNLSLLPIIGIPLPFLSYGGSYLVSLYLLIGLSINLNTNFNNKA